MKISFFWKNSLLYIFEWEKKIKKSKVKLFCTDLNEDFKSLKLVELVRSLNNKKYYQEFQSAQEIPINETCHKFCSVSILFCSVFSPADLELPKIAKKNLLIVLLFNYLFKSIINVYLWPCCSHLSRTTLLASIIEL